MALLVCKNLCFKTVLLLSLSISGGCSVLTNSASPIGVEAGQSRNAIERHLYAGTGIGPSWLEPDTSDAPIYNVNDRVETGGQITLGMDVSRQLALELHSADLGSAGFSPNGRINYHVHGASALVYAGRNRGTFKRQGLSAYGRLGVGYMENSAVGNAEYEKVNPTHLLTGAGIEYMTRFGLGLRAEGILFDQDARYAQLGLVYRTGKRPQSQPIEIVKTTEPVDDPIVAPIAAVAVLQPPITNARESMDTCSEFDGVLEGVNFGTNSASLTRDARYFLDGVAQRLLECSPVPILVSAHTDSVGAATFNLALSQKRAASVAIYLTSKGVKRSRVMVRAFGESQPMESNDSAAGRKRNRRVELITVR